MITSASVNGMSNLLLPHAALGRCITFYNVVTPDYYTFPTQYTLMPNANSTITVLFDGQRITSQLWGPSTGSVILGSAAPPLS